MVARSSLWISFHSLCAPLPSSPAAATAAAAFREILDDSDGADDGEAPLPPIAGLNDADDHPDAPHPDSDFVLGGADDPDYVWNPECGVSFVVPMMTLEAAIAADSADLAAGRQPPRVPPPRCSDEWKQMAIRVAYNAGLVPAPAHTPVRAAFHTKPSVGWLFVLRAPTAEEIGGDADE